MKTMFLGTGIGAAVGFVAFWLLMAANNQHRGGDAMRDYFFMAFIGAIPTAAIGAIIAAVKVLQMELNEIRRELKHWQSIQQLDVELEKPSTQFKAAPPSGMK